jgi:uncharacterized protein (DUF1330 family)
VKSYHKCLIGLIAGILVVATGNNAVHAQQAKASRIYIISEVDAITDPIALKEYGAKVGGTLAPFNRHYHLIARGGKIEGLDGGSPPERVAVIEFESSEQAHAWYSSPAYERISPIRQAATKGRMFIVEGLAP